MLIKNLNMIHSKSFISFFTSTILFISGCNTVEEEVLSDLPPIENKEISDEKIQAIYFGVPSPMETTIILKNSGAEFEASIMYPLENYEKELNQFETSILLGLYSTDLNYCILSSKKKETLDELNAVISLAKQIHLDAVINESTKHRVEYNLDNRDSMQVIIGSTFWKMETIMKENDRDALSSLIVAGGWLEGLYLACELAKINPDNSLIQQIIAVLYNKTNLTKSMNFFKSFFQFI